MKRLNISRRFRLHNFLGFLFLLISLLSSVAAQQSETTQFIYDENSRIRAVLYPNGSITVYHYDEEGNIVSVQSGESDALSIIFFTPGEGVAGQTVTIYGTKFSAVANENVVKFNNVPATVLSSTLNRLTVEIPGNASTGYISVANSNGTVLSSNVFTVIQLQSPTITNVEPNAGKSGDLVTIRGTNFSPVQGSNIVKFNGTTATVNYAALDRLDVVVPDLATTGRITISNGIGSGTSPDLFYILPDEYQSGDIFYTSQINFDEPQTVSFENQSKVAMLVFDGTAGQRVSLKVTVALQFFSSINPNLMLSVRNPDNSYIVSPISMTSIERGRYIDTFILPSTGSYTIYLDKTLYPQDSGNAVVTLYNVPPDVTGAIDIDGLPAETANTVPGQNARLTFTGTAGQQINLRGEVVEIGRGCYFSILKPDGTTLLSPVYGSYTSTFGNSPAFREKITLPVSGTYTVFIDPLTDGVMTLRTKLTSPPPNLTGTISTDGSDAIFTTTEPGQNVEATFSGTAGQKISLKLTNSNGIFNNSISLQSPNGWMILNNTFTAQNYFMDPEILPETGTYKIILNPYGMDTGTMKLNVYTVPPDASETVEIGGNAVNLATTVPGQNAFFTFQGTANQKIAIKFTNFSYIASALIMNPAGENFGYRYLSGGSTLWENITLPSDGTYTVSIDPANANTGNVTIEILDADPPEITGSISVDGAPVDLNFALPFQKARLTFDAEANKSLRLDVSNNSVENSKVSVYKPDGTLFISNLQLNPYTNSLLFENLPETGTYTLVIDPDSAYTGQMTVSLSSITDINETLVIDGAALNLQIFAGQNAYVTFSGNAGQRVLIKFGQVTIPYAEFQIIGPDQSVLESGSVQSDYAFDYHFLPETGTYKINITNPYASSGNIEMSATTSSHISPDTDLSVRFLTANQTAEFTFEASANTEFYFILPNHSFSGGTVNVYNPDGSLLTTMNFFDFYNYFVIQNSGVYRIEVIPAENETGYIQLNLSSYSGGGGGVDTQ